MKLFEIFEDEKSPYRDTTLPLSNYRGAYNPRDDKLSAYGKEFSNSSELWDVIDDMLDIGVSPKVTMIDIDTLLATQDWLSDEPGDGPMWDELERYPVVLDIAGKRYIIDGHNRIARAKNSGRKSIPVYYFNKV